MSSAFKHLCSVLAIAAVAAATDIASAQQIDSPYRDIRTGVYRGHVVSYEVIDGLAVWDGDIILGTPEELSPANVPPPGNTLDNRNKISTISSKESLWPGGIVPYVLDPELTNPYVHDAIRHWNENTVIRLVERTDQPNWVRFMPGSACASRVGMGGGEQRVTLSEYCGSGAGVHEIGHAIGLWHEHQRNDRDPHVWVSPSPLVFDPWSYLKDGPRAVASGPYDYGSVMHYRWIGTLETIPPAIVLGRGGPQLGTSSDTGLSAGDIDGVSRLYGKIPARTTVAANLAGMLIEVDGEPYTAPHSFDWGPGSIHTIGVASPQKLGTDYIRYLFAKWSDGSAQSHSVAASSETTVFIANFIEHFRAEPSEHPPYGGTVRFDPPSDDGFYPRLSFIKAIAEPAEGFSFEHWGYWFLPISGGFSSNPVLSRVSQSYPAFFTQRPLTTIDTNFPGTQVLVDGSLTLLPASFGWEAGSTHTLGSVGSIGEVQFVDGLPGQYIFDGWSDGAAATHDITVSADPSTITANFTRQIFVKTVTHGSGRIVVHPSGSEGGFHDLSTLVQLTARPAPGSKFVSWLGDLSGTENPQSMLMDSNKWVRAFFLDEHTFESARLTSGQPFNLLFGPGAVSADGYNGYWIDVPPGATQLAIHLVTTTPGADVDLYANRDIRPSAVYGANNKGLAGYESQYSSAGPGGNKSITITPESSPPLEPGPYFIAVHLRTQGVRVKRTLTADVIVSEPEIAANVPTFGIPASLITTSEGRTPPPQALEVRNSGRGTLDYQITADQSWLSVSPDQGSSVGETDTVEIAVDPANLELGAFEGAITITAPPAWPVTVPVTLIVIPPPTPLISHVLLATGRPFVDVISPNALFSVFGENFAPPETRALNPRVDGEGKVAVNLADTCLEFNGERVPLFALLPTQINAQAPTGVKPWQGNRVEVIHGCGTQDEQRSSAAKVWGQPVSPAFFTFLNSPSPDGRYPVAALHGGGPGLAGPPGLLPGVELTPAEPGEIVTLFGTGFGLTDPPLEAGQIPATSLPELNGAARLVNRIVFRFDGITVPPEDVFYAGSAPCCAGLYQFAVRVPPSVPDGDLAVQASVWYSNVSAASTPPEELFLTVRRR